MRGKILIFTLGLVALCSYVAAPFVTAWSIKEAVRNGNAAYLESRIDWPKVKASLKASMSDYALGSAASTSNTAAATSAPAPRLSLWQRFKNATGRRVVASMVDNMATPAGLSRLFSYRKTFNERVRGLPDERLTLSLTERIQRTWSRVTRAEFLTPTRFAMEMRDRVVDKRRYAGILELQAGTWRLVHLEVRREGDAGEAGETGRDATSPLATNSAAPPARASAFPTTGLWQKMKQAALR